MGYRSDVHVVFYTRDNPHIQDPMPFSALKLWVDENYPVRESEDEWGATVTYEPDHGYIYVTYQDVKWYPGQHTADVDAAFALFDETFADQPGVAYEFVRIGEEPDDIEGNRSADADYILGVKREIYFER
jgi:hypothetical protein